jgi:hypothetical protein
MPVPTNRNKILPARGNFTDLDSNKSSLLDGEICYAIDQDQYYQKEGAVLVSVGATKAQGLLADSALQSGDNISVLNNDSGYLTNASLQISNANDVNLTNIEEDQVLFWDGTDFINGSAPVMIEVKNSSGSTISKGTPVYVSGTHTSGKPEISLADNDGASTHPAIGLVHKDIANGDEGHVTVSGMLFNVNTSFSGWSAGDALYLSDSPGTLTNVRPTLTAQKVQKVALVTRVHSTAGSVLVIGAGRTNDIPNDLVTLTGVSLGDTTLGTFTGSTISDNESIKDALQTLETAVENNAQPSNVLTTTTQFGGDVSGTYNNIVITDGTGSNLDADLLDGQQGTYYLDYTNFTNTPTIPVDSVNTQTGAVVLDADDIDDAATSHKFVTASDVTALSTLSTDLAGKADLVGGVLDTSQLPDIAISEYKGAVANQTAMLAISGEKGDWVIRNDDSKVYVITGNTPSSASSWTALSYPAGFSGAYSDLTGTPTIPTATSDLTNDSGFISDITTQTDPKYLRSDAADTFSGDLTSSGSARIILKKTDNNVSDHIQFFNGTTRVGEIGCENNNFLEINKETANNIFTPRYIRADSGFFVDGTTKGIDSSGNFIGGTIAGASDYADLTNNTHTVEAATNLAVGWYTIATNVGDRAVARFGLRDTNASDHQSLVFYASHHYGSNSELTVLHSSRFSGSPFRYMRIKEGGTYDGAMLQVYIDDASNNVGVYLLGDNFQSSGWVLKDWVSDGTNPGGLNNFSALTNTAVQIDIDQFIDGGIATTGNIYAGGNTTQYRVLTTADEGSGNNLDADTLDGQEGSYYLDYNNFTNTPTIGASAQLQGYQDYEALIDFGSDTAGTERRIISAALANQIYSTIAFQIDVVDNLSNHAQSARASTNEKSTYYVYCSRTDATSLNSPNNVTIKGPTSGDLIRARQISQGNYEVTIKNTSQYREYRISVKVIGVNGSHTITYRNGDTPSTATASYTSSSSSTNIDYFQAVTADSYTGNGSALTNVDADTLDGAQPDVNRSSSTIVQRHSNGWIYANYFNTTPNDVNDGSTITKVCIETGNDGFIRHGSADAVREFLAEEATLTSAAWDISTSNNWTSSTSFTVAAPSGAVNGLTGLFRITAGTLVWNSVFKFPGGSAPSITSYPAIIPYYVQDSSNILMGNVTEGIT